MTHCFSCTMQLLGNYRVWLCKKMTTCLSTETYHESLTLLSSLVHYNEHVIFILKQSQHFYSHGSSTLEWVVHTYKPRGPKCWLRQIGPRLFIISQSHIRTRQNHHLSHVNILQLLKHRALQLIDITQWVLASIIKRRLNPTKAWCNVIINMHRLLQSIQLCKSPNYKHKCLLQLDTL